MANEIRNTFELDITQYTQAINSAIGSMQTYDKATEEATKDTANLSGESGSAAKKVRELGAASDVSAGKLKKVGEAANDLGKELGGAIEQATGLTGSFGRIGQAAVNLGRAVVTALGPIGIAIGVISVALAGLARIFFDTERGSEKLDRALSILSAVFERVIGLVQEFTFFIADAFTSPQETVKKLWQAIKDNLSNRLAGLIDQFKALGDVIAGVFTLDTERIETGVKNFAESTVQAFTGVDDAAGKVARGFQKLGGEISKAADTGLRIEKLKEQLEDLALVQAKREGELNRTIAEQLDIARDVNRTNQERKAAAEAAIQAQNELAGLAAQQNKLEVERLTLQQSLNDTSIEGQIELAKLKAKGDQIEAERLNANRRAQAIVRGIDKATADAAIANAQRVAEERKKADEEATKAALERVRAVDAIELDLSARRSSLASKELSELREQQKAEIEVRLKAGEDITALLEEQGRARNALLTQIEDAQVSALLSRFDAEFAAAEQAGIDTTELTRIQQEELKALRAQFRDEDLSNLQAYYDQAAALAQQQTDAERELQLVKLQAAQQGAELLKSLAGDNAVAAGLALAAQKAAAVAQIVVTTQASILAAQAAAAAIPPVIPPGIPNPAFPVAQAAAAAQIAKLRANAGLSIATILAQAITGAFHEGGLVGRDGGTKMHGGRDGFLTRVERGEYVMPTNKTAQYMPYLEAMRDGTFERLYSMRMPTSNDSSTALPKWSDKGIVSALGGVGSMSEQRKQTVLLAQVATALNRGSNKRYIA